MSDERLKKWIEDHGLSESEAGVAEAAWQAALSAQSSPGGQGGALELLARFLQEPMHDLDMDHEISLRAARDAIAFALAARQPVTMDDAPDGMLPAALAPVADEWYRLCERRFAVGRIRISGKLAEAIVQAVSAARQPASLTELGWVLKRATPEQVLQYLEDDPNMRACLSIHLSDTAHDDDEGDAAPPTQVVDLEEFREPVVAALRDTELRLGSCYHEGRQRHIDKREKLKRLLSLIDSHKRKT